MMHHYRLVVSYRGHGFEGWQKQGHTKNTLQGFFENAVCELFDLTECWSVASGRTDAGVHALGQVIRLDIQRQIEPSGFLHGLNKRLMPHMQVNKVDLVDEHFHPVFAAVSKEYHYYFTLGSSNPFNHDILTSFESWKDHWNKEKLQNILNLFVGEHDFNHLRCTGTETNSTIRRIYECSISEHRLGPPFASKDEVFLIKVRGQGFLKQMVRKMVGASWDILRVHRQLNELRDTLKGVTPERPWSVAPAQGLYLHSVEY